MTLRDPTPTGDITLTAGEVSDRIDAQGQNITIVTATVGASLLVSIDNGSFVPVGINLQVGVPEGYSSIQFKNAGAASVTFEAVLGWFEYRDSRFTPSDTLDVANVPGDEHTPSSVKVQPTATVTIITGNAARKLLEVHHVAGTDTVWLGGAVTPVAFSGTPLNPSDSYFQEFRGALMANNPGSLTVTLSCVEIE